MTERISSKNVLEATFFLRDFILDSDYCDILQKTLLRCANRWAQGLHIHLHGESPLDINPNKQGALREGIFKLFQKYRGVSVCPVEKLCGNPLGGFAELRGADKSFLSVIIGDERRFYHLNNELHIGNSIAVQVLREKVDDQDSVAWIEDVFSDLCIKFHPVHAHSEMSQEYWQKNICQKNGACAVGIDYARALPGIYWLNYFGQEYCNFIGSDKLLSAPATSVRSVGDGVMIKLHENPLLWDSTEFRKTEDAVLSALGKRYFFDISDPQRESLSPFSDLGGEGSGSNIAKHTFQVMYKRGTS